MKPHEDAYKFLLDLPSREHWRRVGARRRAGVAAPLFSLYSRNSAGVGELPDLKLLADWCALTGLSVIQLLPMNDVGFDFAPYSAQTSFGLEPMYLALDRLRGADLEPFVEDIRELRRAFPAGGERINYGVKAAKLELLWKIFRGASPGATAALAAFVEKNRYWLEDYALFKVIKEVRGESGWESWPDPLKRRDPAALAAFAEANRPRLDFHKWLQWQAAEQFRDAKAYANGKGVLLMGDLPFLVARDSADVWACQEGFKLDLSSGAPTDMFFATGQRWGMPPYNWPAIAARNHDYLVEKLKFAENFYDYYRIDHVVGIFRLWTIPLSEPPETGGLNGTFDPKDESAWEEHGRRLLTVMLNATTMLPCAEDLGVVPDASYKVLKELGIPGMDVQRWTRDFAKTLDFKRPEDFRVLAMATAGTHDTTSLRGWWRHECGTIDELLFRRKCESRGIPYDAVKEKLFDPERSAHGRLRWRRELRSEDKVLWALGRPKEQVGDLVEMFRQSFDEKDRFWRYLGQSGEPPDDAVPALVHGALEAANRTVCVLAVHLLQDWLSLGNFWKRDDWTFRINFPGTNGAWNWSLVLPVALEDLPALPVNAAIRRLNETTRRA